MRRPHAHPPAAEAFAAQAELIAALEHRGSLFTHRKGTILFREGEPSRGVYLLLEGAARLSVQRDDNKTVPIRVVGRRYVLGLPGTILNRSYLFTAKLIEDSRVGFIPSDVLIEFLRERSDICFDVVELLGGELLDLPPVIRRRSIRNRHRNNA
jgi:CRP-like cAMP-binding protein